MNREPLKKLSWIGIPWDGNVTQRAFHQLSKILPGIYSLLEVIVHLVWRDCAPFLTFISYHLSFSILSSGHSSPQSGLSSFCSWIAEGKYKISAVTTSDFFEGTWKHQWQHSTFLYLPADSQQTESSVWGALKKPIQNSIYFLDTFFYHSSLNYGVLLPKILKTLLC